MGRYLDRAKLVVSKTGEHLSADIDGRAVRRVIWETDNAVIFEDSDGHFWRYLRDWGKSWPVVIESHSREPA